MKAIVWVLSGLFILTGCNSLFYAPSKKVYYPPAQQGILHLPFEVKSKDGTAITGWFIPAKKNIELKGTVIQFHGNAENMTSHYMSLVWLTYRGYNLVTFDYRGYGASQGSPDREGIRYDAHAVIDKVFSMKKEDTGPKVILHGQSLGGIIAMDSLIHYDKQSQISCLVAESTFASYQTMAADVLSRFWLTWPLQWLGYVLVTDSYAPDEKIGRIAPVPVFVFHGDKDETVPLKMGYEIFRQAAPPKRKFVVTDGGHLNLYHIDRGVNREVLLSFYDKNCKTLKDQ